MKRYIMFVVVFVITFLAFGGCQFFSPEPKTWDFGSPEEFMGNPDVGDAVDESGFTIHDQNSPRNIENTYHFTGTVSDSSPAGIVSGGVNSTIQFFNQTPDGKISAKETVGGQTVEATGHFITGTSDAITIWQEDSQTLDDYGTIRPGVKLDPSKPVVLHIAAMMSGTIHTSGDMIVDTLTVITELTNVNWDNVDRNSMLRWYKIHGNMDLISSPSSMSVSRGLSDISKVPQEIATEMVLSVLQ